MEKRLGESGAGGGVRACVGPLRRLPQRRQSWVREYRLFVCVHAHVCTHECVYTCTHARAHMCMYTRGHAHMYVYICVHACVCMHMSVRACVYAFSNGSFQSQRRTGPLVGKAPFQAGSNNS